MLKGEVDTRPAVALVILLLFIVLFLLIDLTILAYVAKVLEKGESPVLLAIEQSNGCVTAHVELFPPLLTSVLATSLAGWRFWRKLYTGFMKRLDTILSALVTAALFTAFTVVLMLIKGGVFCGYVCPITCRVTGIRSCNLLWQTCVCKP